MPAAAAPAQSTALTIAERVEASVVVRQLNERAPALRELLGDDDAVARFNRGVVIAITKNPDLLTCTPDSVLLACFEAAAQGLEPTGAAGGAHLVPYKVSGVKVAQLIPDYRGVIRLITRSGDVVSVEASVVKEGDEFTYQLGTDPVIVHVPSLGADRSAHATTHAYAVLTLRGGGRVVTVEDRAGIERVAHRGGRPGDKSPWTTDWDEMAKKTVVKRAAKLAPVEPSARAILVREDELAGVSDVDPSERAETVAAGPTKVSRLVRRLTPAEPVEPDDPADDEDVVVEDPGITREELLAGIAALGLDERYVAQLARERYPDGPLTGPQRRELLDRLAAEEATAGL